MNKKKLFITLALMALIVCMTLAFGACEMISDPAEPDDMGIADMNGGERLLTGLQVAAIGLIVVFVVLIVLIFLIKAFKAMVDAAEKASEGKGKDRAQRKAEAKARRAAEKQAKLEAARARLEASKKSNAPAAEAASANSDEEEEIAAVMAAIYAYYEVAMPAYERSNLKFRVRSIKEIK